MNLDIKKWETPKSQIDTIIHHLKFKGKLTSLQAIHEYGVTRLSDKIHRLRNAGMDIKREDVTTKNRFENSSTYGVYSWD